MRFSTRTTYGLRAMIFLGKNWPKTSVSLPSIAKAEGLSPGYLERLFSCLKKSRLVISEKGASGGYKLSKNPKKIDVFEIVSALEGDMNLFHCIDEKGKIKCSVKCDCKALKVLQKVQLSIKNTLKNIKLSDLI
jgi:Rrf2 family transcriptional regulator, cysteine metabolism repressor